MLDLDKIYHGDCVKVMAQIDDGSIDMTVTSPPYDDMRDYHGYSFDFPAVARELFRVTKDGGVVAWIVTDQTRQFHESTTSFRQALYFVDECGFNLLDTMIYHKKNGPTHNESARRYAPRFEYIFIFSKGRPRAFNPIRDVKNKSSGHDVVSVRKKDGKIVKEHMVYLEYGMRGNIWTYPVGSSASKDKIAYGHPAIMHEKLAADLIRSWTNEWDIVLDPMCGSGTTCKMAKILSRHFVGIDCSEKYVDIARKRVAFKMLPI